MKAWLKEEYEYSEHSIPKTAPCPSCSSKDSDLRLQNDRWYVSCLSCGKKGEIKNTPVDAILSWNGNQIKVSE